MVFAAVTGSGSGIPVKKVGEVSPFLELAEAHGVPWEIFTIRPDGSDLRQLTHETEDTPTPGWSPSGAWIAFSGEIGLYLVDSEGRDTIRVSTSVSGGGMTWFE